MVFFWVKERIEYCNPIIFCFELGEIMMSFHLENFIMFLPYGCIFTNDQRIHLFSPPG